MLRLNGEPVQPGGFDLGDRGLTLGDGLFETIAVFAGRPAALGLHLDRMQAAAAEIRLPFDRAALEREVAALAGEGDAVIRLTLTRGPGARGLAIPDGAAPSIIASRGAFPPNALFSPVRLATSAIRRNPHSFVSRAKTLSYLDSVLAYDAARAAGADDALMLNTDGRVASTAMANLFALVDGTLLTPPVSDGVLPGIVRRLVLDAAERLGIPAAERSFGPEALVSAKTAFATNSVRLVMPVTSVDGRALAGDAGLTGVISDAVAEACGVTRACDASR